MSIEKTPWNPSKKAIKRVKNPLPAPIECPYCKGEVRIAHHEYIYSGRSFGNWPWVYACNDFEGCRAYVGMHPFTDIPLGKLADEETRNERKDAKASFLSYCELTPKSRSDAYSSLAAEMDIDEAECHFGWFSGEQCRKARSAALRLIESTEG